MRYIKFERITEEENPIVRITYKTWYGEVKTRDAFGRVFWRWLDTGGDIDRSSPIIKFLETGLKIYEIK